jgi:hypothetical protein
MPSENAKSLSLTWKVFLAASITVAQTRRERLRLRPAHG